MTFAEAKALIKSLFPYANFVYATGIDNNFRIVYSCDGYSYEYTYMNGRTALVMRALNKGTL
jgi:hypothetical protein